MHVRRKYFELSLLYMFRQDPCTYKKQDFFSPMSLKKRIYNFLFFV